MHAPWLIPMCLPGLDPPILIAQWTEPLEYMMQTVNFARALGKRPGLAADKSLRLAISLTLHTDYCVFFPLHLCYHLLNLGSLDFSLIYKSCNNLSPMQFPHESTPDRGGLESLLQCELPILCNTRHLSFTDPSNIDMNGIDANYKISLA